MKDEELSARRSIIEQREREAEEAARIARREFDKEGKDAAISAIHNSVHDEGIS